MRTGDNTYQYIPGMYTKYQILAKNHRVPPRKDLKQHHEPPSKSDQTTILEKMGKASTSEAVTVENPGEHLEEYTDQRFFTATDE